MAAPLALAAMGPMMQAAGQSSGQMKQIGMAAATAPLALGQAIYSANADKALQKRNKKILAELMAAEEKGNLGLGGAEREAMAAASMNPIARALQQQQRRADAFATVGGTSGGDLAAAREGQAAMMAQAAQQVAADVYVADQMRAQQQRQEIEARQALQAQMRRDDAGLIGGALAQMAGVTGAAAGSAPGTFEAAGMFGQLGKSEQAQMREFFAKYPELGRELYDAEQAKRLAAASTATETTTE